MKILIFNWRDIQNPDKGGAEILTHEIARRWVLEGNDVTLFSSRFEGSKRVENIDGIVVIRGGEARIRPFHYPVHFAAYRWYQTKGKGQFDIVIDEIHGIPFFTPVYVKEKKIALICEVAREIWDVTFSVPFNLIGKTIEKHYFSLYKKTPFLTISPSSKSDLIAMGVKEGNITVLPMGLSIPPKTPKFLKEKKFTLLYVSRLTKAKGANDAIQVARIVKQVIPDILVWIVGQGEASYVEELRQLIYRLGLAQNVKMFGAVSEQKKFELMQKASLLIAPSVKEGWGLTVPEAGYVGTPAVGYNVSGLRDVIDDGKTGVLVDPTPTAMTNAIRRLFLNRGMLNMLSRSSQKKAQKYSWAHTARSAMSVIRNQVR